MSKFFALIITPDLSLSRIWTDSNQVIEMLKLNKGIKIYRSSNDQEAELVQSGESSYLVWKDVPTIEKLDG